MLADAHMYVYVYVFVFLLWWQGGGECGWCDSLVMVLESLQEGTLNFYLVLILSCTHCQEMYINKHLLS